MTEDKKTNEEAQAEAKEAQAEAQEAEAKEEAKEEAQEAVEEKQEEAQEAAEDSQDEEVEVPEQFKALVEQIEKMTVLELNELVKVLEKKFGVSAQAVAVAAPGAAGAAAEEKDEFDVVLASVGDQKIQVIKAVKEVLGLGLKEAKEFVEGAPQTVKEAAKKEEAEEIKAKLEEAGATVELK